MQTTMGLLAEDVVLLAKHLIEFPSVTPNSAGSLEFVSNLLQSIGFECVLQPFGPSKEVLNLYAYSGTEGPNVCFVGHVDVVPAGEWHYEPFMGIIEEGKLIGRGAVDMKGALAAAICAFAEAKKHLKNSRLSFLLTSDEEGEAKYGTQAMLEHIYSLGHRIDFAIVGEPTCKERVGEFIAIARRGSGNFKLRIQGKQGHVAYKGSFQNPISTAIAIAKDLEEAELDKGSEVFVPSTLAITSFDVGNSVVNVVPQAAEIRFNIRFNNSFSNESLKSKVEKLIRSHTQNFELECEFPSQPFVSAQSDLIEAFAAASRQVTGIKPEFTTDGATSDARFVSKYCPCLEFGLQYVRAHQANEWVFLSDLKILKGVYSSFLLSSCCRK